MRCIAAAGVALALLGAPLLGGCGGRSPSADVDARIHRAMDDSMREDGSVDFAALDAALAREAESVGGNDGKGILALQGIMRELGTIQADYAAAMEKATAANAFEYVGIDSLDELRARRALVGELRTVFARHEEYTRTMPDRFDAELGQLGMSKGPRERMVRDFAEGMTTSSEEGKRALELEGEVLAAVDACQGLLETHWGKWTATREEGIVFTGDVPAEDRKQLQDTLDSIVRKAAEQQRLQRTGAANR